MSELASRYELVIEKGQVWQRVSPNGKRVICERTVRGISDGMVRFEEDESPAGALLRMFLDGPYRLKEDA